ncbi:MAG: DUF2252 family protein [Legionellales bacterium]|nr:DUF2252 family protein [Legionellales bacterium]
MESITPELLFWHYLEDEPRSIQEKLSNSELGPYLFFRRSKSAIQARLAELFPHDHVPRTLLHGSPHIDNYIKTIDGFGMIDFDRSYIGPYIWDIVCSLLAINLRNPARHHRPISSQVSEVYFECYRHHFQHPEQAYLPYEPLENIILETWETNIELYLSGHHKWAKKLNNAPVRLNDPIAKALLAAYSEHLPKPNPLKNYQLIQLARTAGSFGRRRYLCLLENQLQNAEPILLDIKETKNYLQSDWPHNKWYDTPYFQQGQRMVQAAMLYAPACVQLESYATVNGLQYWGRKIPTLNRKPAKLFSKSDQIAFARSAASQLARGHRLGIQQDKPKVLLTHFEAHFARLVAISEKIQAELLAVRNDCIKS